MAQRYTGWHPRYRGPENGVFTMSPIDGDAAAKAFHRKGSSEPPEEPSSGDVAARRRLRRSYEAGHRPKFLVLVDDAEDCAKAVYYASRRAMRVAAAEIFRLIQADEDISMLVLAAGTAHHSPGPLIAELGRTAGTYRFPSSSCQRI